MWSPKIVIECPSKLEIQSLGDNLKGLIICIFKIKFYNSRKVRKFTQKQYFRLNLIGDIFENYGF